MNHAERLRIFRPGHTLARLDWQEEQAVSSLMRLTERQLEHLRIQLKLGSKARSLILSVPTVREMRDILARSLLDTAGMSALAIRHEIEEAIAVHRRSKPAVFKAAVRRLEPVPAKDEFLPYRGLEWYRDYALRIVGVEQQAVLDAGRQAIIESIEAGEGIDAQIARLRAEFTGLSRGRLERIVRTETFKVYNQARWQEMDAEPEIVGFEDSEILDTRTCEVCAARNGRRWPKEQANGNMPPYHPNCRGVALPILSWEIETGEIDWNPVPDNAPPVAADWGSTDMRIPPLENRQAARLVQKVAAGAIA